MGQREKFAVIIPDRSDRPGLTLNCLDQLSRMTVRPDHIYHINWSPLDNRYDLVERIHNGVMRAVEDGVDLVFIIENDDAYPLDYFSRFGSMQADFFGDETTYYYNLKNRTFNSFSHPGRSSLFTTGFRISKIQGFQWSGDQFLDLRLWKWAGEKNLNRLFITSGAIGIKHGIGLCGGKGHRMILKNCDPELRWLKGRVDKESFLFYAELSRELWLKESI